jgi:lactate racemase
MPAMIGKGNPSRFLSEDETRALVREALASAEFDARRVLVLIPDGTRTMPLPLMFRLIQECLASRAAALDYLVALGTHPPMNDFELSQLIGQTVVGGRAGSARIINHEWSDAAAFTRLGTISVEEIRGITNGRMAQEVPVTLNKRILEYDRLIICGPVFPHEVARFSGGNKYFFPGIAGPEIIDFTHWLGATLTNYEINGTKDTPVRAVIDRAAAMINRPVTCFAAVVTPEGLAGLYYGSAQEAWQAAADLSAQTHIVRVEKPFRRVLSVMPEMYTDLWTAAKGMYKMEPAIADGGEVVIYAPHITEVSYTHGKRIDEIGYHCLEYFTKQWERFQMYPGCVLAHSTHVKGKGRYDAATGVETARIRVTLATGIPSERCRRINLGYADPARIDRREWEGHEAEGVCVIPRAGEMLYRLNA